ncbi:hypothetical protein [Nocardioides convexus]|uniref:hypothetical protein n=1 Tax=Nocardioides convexus TaxID=2712224 RepID=UPI002418647D|nr:hypothetical protein [Nocardioides convexus]
MSGEWTDTAVGLDGNHAKIAMLQTPDGLGRLEALRVHPPRCHRDRADAAQRDRHAPRRLLRRRPRRRPGDRREARLHPAAGRGDLRGHLPADLRARAERHHRDARRGACATAERAGSAREGRAAQAERGPAARAGSSRTGAGQRSTYGWTEASCQDSSSRKAIATQFGAYVDEPSSSAGSIAVTIRSPVASSPSR